MQRPSFDGFQCPEQDLNAYAAKASQHPDPFRASGTALGYLAMNVLIRAFDRFFNFFSKAIDSCLLLFEVNHNNSQGI